MKKSNFIQTVLNHISETSRKAEVFAELTDHFESKTAYFEEIGYDKDPAAEKAEQAFGEAEDAEIVGEQLNEIKRSKRFFKILLPILTGLQIFVSLLLFEIIFGGIDFNLLHLGIGFSDLPLTFENFLAVGILWCFYLCLLRLSAKYHSITALVFCMPAAIFLSGTVIVFPLSILKALFAFKNIGKLFYYEYFGGYTAGDKSCFVCWLILSIALIAVSVLSVILIIRKKRMTFNKADSIIQKVLRTMVLGLIAVSFLTLIALSAATLTQREAAMQSTARTLATMDEYIIEHFESVTATDKSTARVQLQSLLGTPEVGSDLSFYEDGVYFETYSLSDQHPEKTCFHLYTGLQELNGEAIAMPDREVLAQAKKADIEDIEQLPKPFAIHVDETDYSKTQDGTMLEIYYETMLENPSDYLEYQKNKVLYRYTGDGWEYFNSMFEQNKVPFECTIAHAEMLRSALKEKLCDAQKYEPYIDCDFDLHQKVYAVSYDKDLQQFQADLEVETEYWTEIGGKLYTLTGDGYGTISVNYRVKDGKAEILYIWEPEDGDYYTLSIKKQFSDEGYEQWQKTWDDPQFHSYAATNRRVKNRCGKRVYGNIYSVDEKGECEYSVFNAFDHPGDMKTMKVK